MDAVDAKGAARDKLIEKAGKAVGKALNEKRKAVVLLGKQLKLGEE